MKLLLLSLSLTCGLLARDAFQVKVGDEAAFLAGDGEKRVYARDVGLNAGWLVALENLANRPRPRRLR